MTIQDISLRKLSGSKGGSSAGAVKNTADSLFSTDIVEALIAVSEGPIAGLESGGKSYFIGETQLQDTSGSANFENFELVDYKGSESGEDIFSRLGGFGSSITVNTELATGTAVIRQGTHADIDYVDLRFAITQLVKSNEKGTFDHTGRWMVEYKLVSETIWKPVRTTSVNPLPPQISGDSFDIFYGDSGSSAAIYASPGDRPTYWASAQPISTANAGIWFDTSDNFKPKIFNGSTWYFPSGLVFANKRWTWSEVSSWGRDKATKAFVGPKLTGFVPEQGDYWLDTANGRPLFFNGSSWIQAGSSLRPGAFGSNATGGSVSLSNGEIAITAKTSGSGFVKEFRIPVDRADEPYMWRVTKTSPLDTTELFFSITWESLQEVTAKGYKFPGLACTQLVARASEQFSSIPDFSGIYLGRIVRVPSNYNPVTRVYTGVWDGTWKLAYTNNVAYVCYDLVMNDRYGMNAYYPIVLNKDDVYAAGVWCDTPTASGNPRFTFNGLITEPRGGRDAINYLCGIFAGRFFDDGNGFGVIRIDRDDAPAQTFTPENVVDGIFTYSFTEISTRHNDITVQFTNPDLNWQTDRRRVFDQDNINQYGRIPFNFEAIGCTNEEEAIRRARYQLITGIKETMMVNFKTNRLGLYMSPYDVIMVADEDMEAGLSGRVKSVASPRKILLRDPIFLEPGFSYKINFTVISQVTNDFTVESRELSDATGALTELNTLTDLPDNLPEFAVFTIEQTNGDAAPIAFRVLSISEVDGDPDNVDIQAMQMNRAKWLFIDDHIDTIAELDKYVLDSKKKPEPPQNIRIRVTQRNGTSRPVTTLTLDWDKSPTKTVSRYKVEGSRDNGPISSLGETAVPQFEWDDIPAGEYFFQISAIDLNGYVSKPAYIEHRLIGDTRVLDGVESFRMIDEPTETMFESRSPLFQWGASKDPYFDEYVLQIRDLDDVLIREEHLDRTYYIYEYSINKVDGGGVPHRAFKAAIATRDIYGFISDYTVLTVSNPAPAAPATQSVELLYDAAVIHYDVPPIRDFRGVVVHASLEDGFTPSEENVVYKGPNNNVAVPLGVGEWYFQIAFYDLFEEGDLNYGNQMSLNIPVPSGGVGDSDPPAAPTNVTATGGVGIIMAEWENPVETDLDYIEIFVNEEDDSSTAQYGSPAVGTKGIVAGLKGGVQYYVWVRAVDRSGNRSEFNLTPAMATPVLIGATEISPNAIKTQHLDAGSITAEKFAVGAITAQSISVSELSAFSANMGTLTAGMARSTDSKMQIDLNNKRILIADFT
ncbi:host specificity protein J [Rhizobium ruizarguesonis]